MPGKVVKSAIDGRFVKRTEDMDTDTTYEIQVNTQRRALKRVLPLLKRIEVGDVVQVGVIRGAITTVEKALNNSRKK